MRFAVAAVILLAAPLAAAAPAKSTKSTAKSSTSAKTAAPQAQAGATAAGSGRLRHETIGLGAASVGAGYEATGDSLARKDDDTALTRTLTATAGPSAVANGPFNAVEATVMRKRPKATGRIRVSFDVDRRGRVVRPMVFGFDGALDRAIEAQLKTSVLPVEYRGQRIETVLAFQRGKLLRR